MMKIDALLKLWEQTAEGELTQEQYQVRLPLEDAARLQALAKMYPRRSLEEIITDLLAAALGEVESNLPYVRGDTIVAMDEEGDPLYEDIGPTPRYLSLTREILQKYQRSDQEAH
jgi:hypothetical protein